MKIDVHYKYGTVFRNVVNVAPVEWCNQMEGHGTNLFVNMGVDLIRESVPYLFQKCPYEV